MSKIDMREKFTPNDGADPVEKAEKPRVEAQETVDEDGEEVIVPASGQESSENEGEEGQEPDGGGAEEPEPGESPASAPAQEPEGGDGKEDDEITRRARAVEALRRQEEELLENVRALRAERRGLKGNPLAPQEPLVVDAPRQDADALADVDPTSVEIVERVLKAKGYVRKDELEARDYRATVSSAQSAWLEEHPEYKPENDPKDENWNRLAAVVGRFKPPSNAKEARTILDMAHREVSPFVQRPLPVKPRASVEAGKEKIKASSPAPGGGSAKSAKPAAPKSGIDFSHLKGFSEDEINELRNG